MNNRMSVLSRRLGRFAGGFSFATVAIFAIGLYVTTNAKGEVLFLFAGLVLVCLFASFLLWLAHGFAWALIPEKPAEASKPVETLSLKPVETLSLKPAETLSLKPADAPKPAEVKPVDPPKPAEAMKPAEPLRPAEPLGHAEPTKPVEPVRLPEAKKPAEVMKAVEEKVVVQEEDPPDAKYTITGKRVY